MMGCEKLEEKISSLIDGELSPDEERALCEHLSTCPRCQAFLADLRELQASLSALSETGLPQEELKRVKERVKTGFKPTARRWPVEVAVAVAGIAAVLAVVLGVNFFFQPSLFLTGRQESFSTKAPLPETGVDALQQKRAFPPEPLVEEEETPVQIAPFAALPAEEGDLTKTAEELLKTPVEPKAVLTVPLASSEIKVELLDRTGSGKGEIYWFKITIDKTVLLLAVNREGKVLFEKTVKP